MSRHHFQPTAECQPRCWTHQAGHSSGSDKCPLNVAYKRAQRRELDVKRRVETQLRETPEEHQSFHRELIQLKDTIRSSATSYAGAIKGAKIAVPNISVPKVTIDPNMYVMQYIGACIN